jgi:hypothetical protein
MKGLKGASGSLLFSPEVPTGESDCYRIVSTHMTEQLAETWGLQRKP